MRSGAYRLGTARGSNPYVLAAALGLRVLFGDDLPWDVAADADTVLARSDSDERVRRARVWLGIACCILTRSGSDWSEADAESLAEKIRLNMRSAI